MRITNDRSSNLWRNTQSEEINKKNSQQVNQIILTQDIDNPISVEISTDAAQRLNKTKNNMEEIKNRYQDLITQLENSRKQSEAEGKTLNEQEKCMIIATRIMAGDNVPEADQRYLVEHDPGLYARAVLMRRHKENPHDYKRISEDEEPAQYGAVNDPVSNETMQAQSDEIRVEVNIDSEI